MLDELIRLAEVNDDLKLTEALDYGSFPSWDSSGAAPVYSHLRVGPPLAVRFPNLLCLTTYV
jgi:hypothetical protein